MDRSLFLEPDEVVCGPAPLAPKVVDVEPLEDHRLKLLFASAEVRIFDAKPYLDKGGVFEALFDTEAFAEVWVEAGSVEWASGAGLSYATLYEKSVPGSREEFAARLADRMRMLAEGTADVLRLHENTDDEVGQALAKAHAALDRAATLAVPPEKLRHTG